MAKEILFKGKTQEQMKSVSREEFLKMISSRQRRTLKRGLTDSQKLLMTKINKVKEGKYKKPIKTHCRDMIIIPEMLGLKIHIHNGKLFNPVEITVEMLGQYLGEFAPTRGTVKHSAPGIGATKSSSSASVK